MRTNDAIRAHLLKDMPDVEPLGHITLAAVEANRRQFNEFVEMMNARMRQGFFRYGRNEPGEPARIKYFEHLQQCVESYKRTGNQEYLIDAANSCRLEMYFPSGHPNPYFTPNDDDFHAELMGEAR